MTAQPPLSSAIIADDLLSMFDLRPDELILRRERARLADLLSDHADKIGGYVTNPVDAVRFAAYLISLNTGTPDTTPTDL